MKIPNLVIKIWFVLFIPFLFFKLHDKYIEHEKYKAQYSRNIRQYVGSKFSIDNFINISGVPVKLDLSKSEMTVIDFWFNACPPCIADIKKYSTLIKGKEKKISVVTVSINSYKLWRNLFKNKRFEFLSDSVNNLTHLVLKSAEASELNNDIPGDNHQLLQNTFQSTKFPMYFVLDKKGTIVATPFSLSEYLSVDIPKKNRFIYFLTNKETWSTDYLFIPLAFVEFSGFYWIIINFFLLLIPIASFYKEN